MWQLRVDGKWHDSDATVLESSSGEKDHPAAEPVCPVDKRTFESPPTVDISGEQDRATAEACPADKEGIFESPLMEEEVGGAVVNTGKIEMVAGLGTAKGHNAG